MLVLGLPANDHGADGGGDDDPQHPTRPAGDVVEPGAFLGYFFYTRPLSLALVLAPGALLTLMILPAVRKKTAEENLCPHAVPPPRRRGTAWVPQIDSLRS